MKDSFTVMEISRMLNVSRSSVLNWIKEGRLASFRLPGGNNRVRRDDLLKFMREYELPIDLLDKAVKRRVLIVDDDPNVLALLEEAFAHEPDFAVRTATSGFTTGIVVQEFKPHLVVLDIRLGDIDGREVCQILKQDLELGDAKVIGISGRVSQAEIDAMLADGFACFMSKPIRIAELIAKARELIGT